MFTFLSPEARSEIQSEYRKRVLAVAFSMAALVMLAGAVWAAPAFVNIMARDTAEKAKVQSQVAADSGTIAALESQVRDIGAKTAALKGTESQKTLVSILELVASRITPGIMLSDIALARTDTGSIVLNGTAATRDALVTFSKSLQSEPSFSGISLPVSALAKSKDISFSISINSHF